MNWSSRVIEAPVRPITLTRKLNCCSAFSMPGTVRDRFGKSQPVVIAPSVRCCPTCPRSPGGRRQGGGGSSPCERSGEPVQMGLAKRGRRWDGNQQGRAVHVPLEAGAATDSAGAPVDGHGHLFRLGVDQPDYASPPAFRLVGRDTPFTPQ